MKRIFQGKGFDVDYNFPFICILMMTASAVEKKFMSTDLDERLLTT
jgi:hypothetical protein